MTICLMFHVTLLLNKYLQVTTMCIYDTYEYQKMALYHIRLKKLYSTYSAILYNSIQFVYFH